MAADYDVIVVGGGHNGLTAAATLGQSGRRVLLLEARAVLGGAAATEELFPGYRANSGAESVSLYLDEIIRALFLPMHGLELRESPVGLFAPGADGRALTFWADARQTAAGLPDAERYLAFAEEVAALTSILRRMLLLTPPPLAGRPAGDLAGWAAVGWQLRRQGEREMMRFMRVLPLPVADYLDRWFEDEALKGALGMAGVTGTMLGPRAGGTALMMLYQNLCGLHRFRYALGGVGALAQALAASARAAGAEIRTSAAVSSILVEAGRVAGVQLAGGGTVRAPLVLSSADPRRTLLGLVGPQELPPTFMRAVRAIRYRGSTAKVVLALDGLPHFRGQETAEQLGGRIGLCPDLETLERAYDDAKYGRLPARPCLEAVIPTIHDPSLAPPGRHLMGVTVRYAPYDLRDGSWVERREELGDRVVETLARYAPGIDKQILERRTITPLDYEEAYRLTEGSIFHGQMGLDQLLVMRPVPGWSRYRTPIAGLFLCGAGAHPGGGVTGAPGYNAAREALGEDG